MYCSQHVHVDPSLVLCWHTIYICNCKAILDRSTKLAQPPKTKKESHNCQICYNIRQMLHSRNICQCNVAKVVSHHYMVDWDSGVILCISLKKLWTIISLLFHEVFCDLALFCVFKKVHVRVSMNELPFALAMLFLVPAWHEFKGNNCSVTNGNRCKIGIK